MHAKLHATRGEPFTLKLELGGQERHETSATHHIRWIRLYFLPEDGPPIPVEVASFRFSTHAAPENGSKAAPVSCGDSVHCTLILDAPGTLMVMAFCSMHGFMEREIGIHLVETVEQEPSHA